ncbi:hypothetical protein N5J07_17995 [Comamonas aquatica]|uniref:hypothetical protein n=1 Tax=Comamonas aquatica TaxID=225991 RepID=UPI002448E9F4|nr:hypothetical protein [Comamonas aquatica]MDH0495896.1 hypothetical protein [Comamonas aquatica]MDH1381305.1 hypothetical protein [Comamonas aquatica]MDH1641398.1 hypothetical protein [Comamonas aquatica]
MSAAFMAEKQHIWAAEFHFFSTTYHRPEQTPVCRPGRGDATALQGMPQDLASCLSSKEL